MTEWIVAAASAGLAVLALVLAASLLRARTVSRRELAAARAETSQLRAQIEEIERRLATPPPSEPARKPSAAEYRITRLGDDPEGAASVDPALAGGLFADLVLRAAVVKAASLAHGLKVALAPESRNRIRFEVRREVKRARRQRRADVREAVRDWETRRRSEVPDNDEPSTLRDSA